MRDGSEIGPCSRARSCRRRSVLGHQLDSAPHNDLARPTRATSGDGCLSRRRQGKFWALDQTLPAVDMDNGPGHERIANHRFDRLCDIVRLSDPLDKQPLCHSF